MKKILLSIGAIVLTAAVATGVTMALYSDTETALGNTFAAGVLDLEINGESANTTARFSADNMAPGETYNAGCVTLSNAGTLDGVLSVMAGNLVSNDNTLTAPEIAAGDLDATEIDPTGYNANTGDGELWDQITVEFCLDNGTGSHTGNGICDWDDTIIKGFSSTQDDYSATYSIKTDTDLAAAKNYVLAAGSNVDFCAAVKFIDDASNSWWGGQGALSNNMAMSDDAQLDLTFGLTQIQN